MEFFWGDVFAVAGAVDGFMVVAEHGYALVEIFSVCGQSACKIAGFFGSVGYKECYFVVFFVPDDAAVDITFIVIFVGDFQ